MKRQKIASFTRNVNSVLHYHLLLLRHDLVEHLLLLLYLGQQLSLPLADTQLFLIALLMTIDQETHAPRHTRLLDWVPGLFKADWSTLTACCK